jgi:hypothetical protein
MADTDHLKVVAIGRKLYAGAGEEEGLSIATDFDKSSYPFPFAFRSDSFLPSKCMVFLPIRGILLLILASSSK